MHKLCIITAYLQLLKAKQEKIRKKNSKSFTLFTEKLILHKDSKTKNANMSKSLVKEKQRDC